MVSPILVTLGDLLRQGGWTMAPIYLCSIVALAVFLKKLLDLRGARLGDLDWVEPMLQKLRAGRLEDAAAAAEDTRNPAGRVARATLGLLGSRPERAEAEARRVGSLELQKLESQLPLLSFIAQVAPLLGLLGTVLGMVELFVGLQGAGLANVDVGRLSSGIWKALLTTAAGLSVAVPVLAAHAWLTQVSERFRLMVGDVVQRILNEAP
ncbi:MAG: MotA/TolQ/ExbB proton channel family protein [Myxococcota bacterium]